MSFRKLPLFNDQTTFFTLDKDQIKLKEQLSKTTSSNKNTFLKNGSKCNNVVGNSELETELENYSTAIINNSFIENNIDALNINSHSELEDPLNFDNLHSSVYNSLTDSIVIEITNEDQSQINAESAEDSENQNSYLNRKTNRDKDKKLFGRKDNGIKEVKRYFFNHYLKELILMMEKICGFKPEVKSFPEKFIFFVSAKKNNHFLDYTFEQLLLEKKLYENRDPKDYYSVNLNVINKLHLNIYKDVMEKTGCDKILKMTYRNLFENFLKSEIYKKHIDELIKKKKKVKARRFKHCAETFLCKRK